MNFKFQISNFKFTIPLLLFAVAFSFGCNKVEKPVRDGKGPLAIIIEAPEPPESHTADLKSPNATFPAVSKLFKSSLKGLDYWRAYHPTLVTGTNNPALMTDKNETCLDCHDPKTSCNNCHSYVGVKQITAEVK
ncbi:MAG: hypothetical protein HY756_12445 [Nitrospirae bacterium]|nr:hypothetical protein [Nitrospirota bacterium]